MTLLNRSTALQMKMLTTGGISAAIGIATVIAAAGPALAQTTHELPKVSQQTAMSSKVETDHFSNKTIMEAGHALSDIQKINKKYIPQMQVAQKNKDQKQMQIITQKAKHDALQKLSSDGISPQKYQKVMIAAQNNPQLRTQILDAAGTAQNK